MTAMHFTYRNEGRRNKDLADDFWDSRLLETLKWENKRISPFDDRPAIACLSCYSLELM